MPTAPTHSQREHDKALFVHLVISALALSSKPLTCKVIHILPPNTIDSVTAYDIVNTSKAIKRLIISKINMKQIQEEIEQLNTDLESGVVDIVSDKRISLDEIDFSVTTEHKVNKK